MEYSSYKISLDVRETSTHTYITAKQGDTARKVFISLTEGGKPYKIEEGARAWFIGKKADGNNLRHECEIEGNIICYTFNEQTSSAVGEMPCEIVLADADGGELTSARFVMLIEERVFSDGELIESAFEAPEIQEMIREAAEEYLIEHPIITDATLTDPYHAANAKATGERIAAVEQAAGTRLTSLEDAAEKAEEEIDSLKAEGAVKTSSIADKSVTPEKLDRFYMSISFRPALKENDDLNDYVNIGGWACKSTTIGATLKNSPANGMFTLDVVSASGSSVTEMPETGNFYGLQIARTPTFLEFRRYFQQNTNSSGVVSRVFGDWVRVLTSKDMYLPIANSGAEAAVNLTADQVGVLYGPGSGAGQTVDVVYTITADLSKSLPNTVEFPILWRYGKSLCIKFDKRARSAMSGDTGYTAGRTYRVLNRFETIVLKKMEYAANFENWIVMGNVEVVTT